MNNIDANDLAKVITKAGIILMENGAETYRVEDTMYRIAKAYGAEVVDAYATPTLLIISFSLNGELYHNVKRVKTKSTDLSKISEVNTLSRMVCANPLKLSECNELLDKINQSKMYNELTILFGAFICSFGFTIFFNGDIKDAIIAAIVGIVTEFFYRFLNKIEFSAFFNNVLSGALLTLLATLISNYCHKNIVIISVMMLLVPGLAITNAIKDTVNGDLVSGLTRTTEAIFVAIALALGSGLVLILTGGF